MTRTSRLSVALSVLRWGPLDVATQCGVNERTVRRWLAGAQEPPERIVGWCECLASFHAAHPPP